MSKYSIIGLVCALILSGACARSLDPLEPDGGAGESLHLSTRADERYDDYDGSVDPYDNGEDLIDRVDLFFFSDESSTEAPFYTYELTNVGANAFKDLTIKIPVDLIDDILKAQNGKAEDEKTVYIYALVNLPEKFAIKDGQAGTIDGKPATLSVLKQIWVEEPGFLGSEQQGLVPGTFVMRGGVTAHLLSQGKLVQVYGTIILERLASKIRLWARIPDYIYVDTATGRTVKEGDEKWPERDTDDGIEKWKPLPYSQGTSEVKLYLYNLATKGRIDAYLGDYEERSEQLGYAHVDRSAARSKFARLLDEQARLNAADEDPRYPYSHEVAYYSYPNKWDSSTPTERHQTYVIIELPWARLNKATGQQEYWQTCYYQIPINALRANASEGDSETEDVNRLIPNRYYRTKLNIGMLGSKDLGDPYEIEDASYEVVEWTNAPVSVSIKDRRYLVVNQPNWVMNNVTTLEIPFSTSHKTVVTACYVNYFRYNDEWGTSSDSNHTGDEFNDWIHAANDAKIRDGEGPVWLNASVKYPVTKTRGDSTLLYYKSTYFYDKEYADMQEPTKDNGKPYLDYGFRYYAGHEHPKTFQSEKMTYAAADAAGWDKLETYRQQAIAAGESVSKVFSFKDAWEEYNRRNEKMGTVYTCKIDDKASVIRFNHPLVQWREIRENGKLLCYVPLLDPHNAENKELWGEFSRCEIIIKIKHADRVDIDDSLYEETIYITQYPGMYIEVSHNYGTTGSSGNEFVLVNNNNRNDGSWSEVDRLDKKLGEENTNPNMYVINTTQLSEPGYQIGDPRALFSNLSLSSGKTLSWRDEYDDALTDQKSNEDTKTPSWSTVSVRNIVEEPDLDLATKNTYRLRYYYPADESSEVGAKEDFIAPAFRIASSFGRVQVNGRIDMRRRCAAYQEAGRPAGRWRMPTKAEVKYIAQLSADGKIPILFGDVNDKTKKGYYWTANGGVTADALGNVEDEEYGYRGGLVTVKGRMAVRCVYDEWYWTKIDAAKGYKINPRETNFYWGDMRKDNTQDKPTLGE